MKIKDRIALGVIAGLAASLPVRLTGMLAEKTSLRDFRYRSMAGTLVVPKSKINTLEGKIMGEVVNGIGLSLAGIVTAYLFSATGRDHCYLKGIGVSYFFGVVLGGIFPKMGLVEKPKFNSRDAMFGILDHIIHGSTCALIVSKLGDEGLFPRDNEIERVPLINTNEDEQ